MRVRRTFAEAAKGSLRTGATRGSVAAGAARRPTACGAAHAGGPRVVVVAEIGCDDGRPARDAAGARYPPAVSSETPASVTGVGDKGSVGAA